VDLAEQAALVGDFVNHGEGQGEVGQGVHAPLRP
jgi:hypothetical protein